jgi:hypothetical protein
MATVRAAPSVPKRPTALLRPWKASAAHHATRSRPASECFPINGFLDRPAPSAPKLRSSEPTAGESAPAKRHPHTLSSNVNILIRSLFHTLDRFVHMARSWRSAPAVTERFRRPYPPNTNKQRYICAEMELAEGIKHCTRNIEIAEDIKHCTPNSTYYHQ